ncbi:MAG: acyl-CoA thioesterase II [Stappia sp.]|uniref:acyl-CoA thioesterase II n=1 Tax=Stappia sp. TaxID=1870903 RepID=UPI000C68DBA4|nr:acyl-CoA thioesterase II [Stappia sp.]MAA99550.1 acyl-CoA thioesterase II [Stappia sp.]MBM20365.1 acyl-CoA thioesterase II [Stappia sp.]
MPSAVDALLSILDLEPLEHNLFRGMSPQVGWQRVFGGQVIGQALVAASRTVPEERMVHSLHAYFLRPGDPAVPIIYEVDRIRDGGSFTTRRVVAIQHGRAIYSMSASFQKMEEGLEHQTAMPDVPAPEDLPSEAELKEKFLAHAPEAVRRYWERERPIELRPVDLTHYFSRKKLVPSQNVWVRASAPLPDDPRIHTCVLAYASDMTLLDTSLFAHGTSVFDTGLQVASLDHAMWFHRPFRADEWLLYVEDSPSSSGGRGFTRGSLYTRSGELVASVAQEGLIRVRDGKGD